MVLLLVLCSNLAFTQSEMRIPLIGEKAPSFKAETTNGPIKFPKDFGTNWKLILSHPKDFTPVCSTELLALAEMQDDFKELNVDLLLVSTDPLYDHVSWKDAIEKILSEDQDPVEIEFPLVEDSNLKISKKYGMLHDYSGDNKDVRGVFLIDPQNIIRFTMFYPTEIGRNMAEIMRAVIALQTTYETDMLTPVNWEPGDDVLLRYYNPEDLENPDIYQRAWFMTFRKL